MKPGKNPIHPVDPVRKKDLKRIHSLFFEFVFLVIGYYL
jgi:hypothetical protein